MRWNIAYSGLMLMLGSIANLQQTDAFIQSHSLQRAFQKTSFASKLNVGPDGDDLPDPSQDVGAVLTDDMKQKIKEQNTDESQGGSRFKEMMAKAQSAEPTRAMGGAPLNPFAGVTESLPNLEGMSEEDQAAMFRQMMSGSYTPAPGTYAPPPPPQKNDGRKVGRNRDADAIQNTSDLYFAQLKRDSTVRTMARIRGEDQIANAVFEDESIDKLKDLMYDNPYLKDHREKEKQMLDDSMNEIIAIKEAEARRAAMDKTSSGINYRQKLMERKNMSVSNAPRPPAVTSAPQPPASQVQYSPPSQAAQAPPQVQSPPVVQAPPQVQSPPAVQAPPQVQPSSGFASKSSDDQRQTIRTLMGLLLKHRGGEGFGRGGLKGPEVERFETLLNEVTTGLIEEAKLYNPPAGAPAASAVTPPPVVAPATVAAPAPAPMSYSSPPSPTAVAPPAVSQAVASTISEELSPDSELLSILKCVEGATQMYTHCPPEMRDGVLMQLRSALTFAVNICNKHIAEKNLESYNVIQAATIPAAAPPAPIPTPQPPAPQQTYSAPQTIPAPQTSSAPQTSFADSLSASSVTEQKCPITTQAPPPSVETPVTAPPTVVYDGNDSNSQALESIYKQLKSAAGDGKMGLRKDLTSKEASNLVENLLDMRSILMQELESGIPTH